MSTPIVIGENVDPITFVLDRIKNYVKDENDNEVPVVTIYPKKINEIPRVVVHLRGHSTKWISIPAVRQRWTATIDIQMWSTSVRQRYSMDKSFRDRIYELTQPPALQLADNYVFLWLTDQRPADIVTAYGQPVFKVDLTISLMYDLVNSSALFKGTGNIDPTTP
jgi:hypothetical protein